MSQVRIKIEYLREHMLRHQLLSPKCWEDSSVNIGMISAFYLTMYSSFLLLMYLPEWNFQARKHTRFLDE